MLEQYEEQTDVVTTPLQDVVDYTAAGNPASDILITTFYFIFIISCS